MAKKKRKIDDTIYFNTDIFPNYYDWGGFMNFVNSDEFKSAIRGFNDATRNKNGEESSFLNMNSIQGKGMNGAIGQMVDTTGQFMSSIDNLLKDKRPSLERVVGIYKDGGNLFLNGGNKASDVVGTVINLVGNGIQQAKIEDTSGLKSKIVEKGFTPITTSSNEDLISQWRNNRNLHNVSTKDIRNKTIFGDIANSVSASGQGFSAGSHFGPWGAAIGAVVGGVSSLIGSIFGRSKAKRERNRVNSLIADANQRSWNQLDLAASNLENQNAYNMQLNYAKLGGPLHSNGTIWDNGVNIIGNGGTHEENPYEGVPMGVDSKGVPNLVEEGEVIYDNKVLTNHLIAPKHIAKKYTNKKNPTYADVFKSAQKESEERPFDFISQRGLEASFNEIYNAQESEKAKKMAIKSNKFVDGGPVDDHIPYKYYEDIGNDWYTDIYKNFVNDLTEGDVFSEKWLADINAGKFGDIGGNTFTIPEIKKLAVDNKLGPVHKAVNAAAMKREEDRLEDVVKATMKSPERPELIPIPKVNNTILDGVKATIKHPKMPVLKSSKVYNDDDEGINFFRKAPLYASGMQVLADMLGANDPDYTDADIIGNAVNSPRTATYTPIGNYMVYNPFDRNYYTNQLLAQANAASRAASNVTGGNRAAAMAGILSSGYNTIRSLGELYRQGDEYNLNQLAKVLDFNRGTNMANTEGALKASMANMSLNELDLNKAIAYAKMRDAISTASSTARSQNLSNFIDNLSEYGKDIEYRDWLKMLQRNKVLVNKDGKIVE